MTIILKWDGEASEAQVIDAGWKNEDVKEFNLQVDLEKSVIDEFSASLEQIDNNSYQIKGLRLIVAPSLKIWEITLDILQTVTVCVPVRGNLQEKCDKRLVCLPRYNEAEV